MRDPAALAVRDATPADAAACAAIYAPYVRDTAITFELDPPTDQQMAERIAAASGHAWLVAERDDSVIGYAFAGPFATRAAYRWACEVSVYLEPARRGRGAGTALYRALLERLTDRGYRVAVARISLPNDASLAMHRSFGFRDVGVHRAIGFKNGVWHDVALAQLELAAPASAPSPPD